MLKNLFELLLALVKAIARERQIQRQEIQEKTQQKANAYDRLKKAMAIRRSIRHRLASEQLSDDKFRR